jgi:hypothetical protein
LNLCFNIDPLLNNINRKIRIEIFEKGAFECPVLLNQGFDYEKKITCEDICDALPSSLINSNVSLR